MQKDLKKVLVVRTDKIGDVVLTTPAIAALRKKLPTAEIIGLASSIGADVYQLNPHLNAVIVLEKDFYSGVFGFFRLVKKIRTEKFQAAVCFQTISFVAFAILFSGIPVRIGPYSKWWSWLCYNFGRRQNRSAVEMHEADYNIQLLKYFEISVAGTKEKTHISVSDEARREALRFFVEKGISKKFKTVAIHPGMAGSALNWSENQYIQLGKVLLKKYNIIITGGPGEEALVDKILHGISQGHNYQPDKPIFTKYIGTKGLKEMVAILDHCDGVVAPSTGPMHLAVALRKKVVSVFPPIKVQSALRWGPYGESMGTNLGISQGDTVSVLVPDVNCAEDFRCALSACIYYPCMPRVAVADIELQIIALIEGSTLSLVKARTFSGYDLYDSLEGEE
ncbi:MAG: glycosyltransferase family 9 protein [Oligoflexia bacterium]|nr:glycosyltransferase family 9 protein [Oligoflexia bacterium]